MKANADLNFDGFARRNITLPQNLLYLRRALDRVQGAVKFDQESIADGFDFGSAVLAEERSQ